MAKVSVDMDMLYHKDIYKYAMKHGVCKTIGSMVSLYWKAYEYLRRGYESVPVVDIESHPDYEELVRFGIIKIDATGDLACIADSDRIFSWARSKNGLPPRNSDHGMLRMVN